MMMRHAIAACLYLLLASPPAGAQCILANPSFEILGSGGQVFGGWNQFGAIGQAPVADHGSRAARVSGPNTGAWGVSGYWQSQDCNSGEQWRATGQVRIPSGKPLAGESSAIVNIEWRDGGGSLIDYESFAVATPTSATDAWMDFSVQSGSAPVGTASCRILLAALQGPSDPVPDVYFDQVTFRRATAPTLDDVQWNDFPGGKTLVFGGETWRVKGPGYYGPGPNLFCDTSNCVWVDAQGRLHLTLQKLGGNWYSTEITTEEALGYGDYVLTTEGRLDQLDIEVVLGIFLWQYGPCWDYSYTWWNAFNEIDIEYSRWRNPGSHIAQFVAQPFDWPGNISRFDFAFAEGEIVSHAMRWLPDRVEYRVWRGGPDDESPENLVHAWTYTGPHIPRPEQPRMHLNLWKLEGTPAANQEVVFRDFRFEPEGGTTAIDDDVVERVPARPAGRLFPAAPNPFNPSTTIRFDLDRSGPVQLAIYDLAGRHVRTLVDGWREAGIQQTSWNGRDDSGRIVASGSYLVRLRGEDFVESQTVTLLK